MTLGKYFNLRAALRIVSRVTEDQLNVKKTVLHPGHVVIKTLPSPMALILWDRVPDVVSTVLKFHSGA